MSYNKNRIVTNKILHPTKRVIENWNRDIRTSDGPNTSSFISLDDIAIPYDSHYTSRIVLPANSMDYLLNYGIRDNATFLLIKVTYNGNYDDASDDDYDPLYYHEPTNYSINYYFEDDISNTYPIGRLLLLNGSYKSKLKKIYLNNPLDYDVVLDIFCADVEGYNITTPENSAITINNLYYSDIITDNTLCLPTGFTSTSTTTIYDDGLTTTTTTYDVSTTTSTTFIDNRELMKIFKSSIDNLDIFYSTGNTLGLFDYCKNGDWIYDAEESSFVEFNNLTGITLIRFYFDENDKYKGILKTNYYNPIDRNNGLYFVDLLLDDTCKCCGSSYTNDYLNEDGTYIIVDSEDNTSNDFNNNLPNESGETFLYTGPYTGSTEFIISEYVVDISGYTIYKHYIPYDSILFIEKKDNSIIISTTIKYYTLKFLTDYDFIMSYNRIKFIYDSYLDSCVYLSKDNIYKDNIIIINFNYTTTTTTIQKLSIHYNYSEDNSWIGGDKKTPYQIYLNLIHDNYTGWTLEQLKKLFINHVYDYYNNSVNNEDIIINLYKNGSPLKLNGIFNYGVYNLSFIYSNYLGDKIVSNINNINVVGNVPNIIYNNSIFNSKIIDNTNFYVSSSNQYIPNIYINSGFTFNLGGFDNNIITKSDIISNIIGYIEYSDGKIINKYLVNIKISKNNTYEENNTYENVTNPGTYCIEVSLEYFLNNKITNYFIMNVIWDISVYSKGYWQDNKVWIDNIAWIDYLKK